MKVAIAHDWLTGMRGGERVLEAIIELFPEASLYTLIHHKGSVSPLIENRVIHTSFLNSMPAIEKHYRKFLPLFPMAVEKMEIKEDLDLLISSSHCVIKGLKKPKNCKHISYIHSPMRYIYDQFDTYFGENAPFYQQLGAKFARGYLTDWDISSNSNVDLMIANSQFVAERIKKYYGRDSVVVYPFVELNDFVHLWNTNVDKQDYYCMVTAFAPNKRVDLAISAFNQNKKRLVIIGSGQEEKKLRDMSHGNIEFLGNVSRKEIVETLSKAKGFIFPGVEDFGITPLESLASLTPVVAFRAGGVLETLTDEVASFFDKQEEKDLNQAIDELEKRQFNKQHFINRAKIFSRESFQSNLKIQIERLWHE